MNITFNLSTLCDTAEYLSKNDWLSFFNLLQILLALAGILLIVTLFRVQGTHLAFHENARLLLISHHIWTILFCIFSFAWHFFDAVRFGTSHPNDTCEYLISQETAVLFRAPGSFAVFGNGLALMAMVAERIFATSFYRTYETKGTLLGWILIVAQWCLATLMISLLVLPLDWTEVKVQVSLASGRTSGETYWMLIIMAIMELLTLITFHSLLLYNKRLKTRLNRSTLTETCQIDENIRAVRLMIPMIWTHAVCFLPSLVAITLFIKLRPDLDPRDYSIFTAAFNWITLYGPLLPTVLFWRHKVLRTNLWKKIKVKHNTVIPARVPRPDELTEQQQRDLRNMEIIRQICNGMPRSARYTAPESFS